MNDSEQPPILRVGIIGCGKVGAVLGAAMRDAGHEVVGVTAVSDASRERAEDMLPGVPVLEILEVVRRAEMVFLTIPDDEIASLVNGLARVGAWDEPRIAVHFAGALGLDVLDPVVERGGHALALHPAMSFSGTSKDLERLSGCLFAVTASESTLMLADAVVLDLGGEPVMVPEFDRLRYHAALAHGSNHMVTLVGQAMQVLRDCGFDNPSRVLRPILEATLDNALERGDRALTGPIARGDVHTIEAHLEALSAESSDVYTAYLAMARATAERTIRRHALTPELIQPLLDVLSSPPPDEDLEDFD